MPILHLSLSFHISDTSVFVSFPILGRLGGTTSINPAAWIKIKRVWGNWIIFSYSKEHATVIPCENGNVFHLGGTSDAPSCVYSDPNDTYLYFYTIFILMDLNLLPYVVNSIHVYIPASHLLLINVWSHKEGFFFFNLQHGLQFLLMGTINLSSKPDFF